MSAEEAKKQQEQEELPRKKIDVRSALALIPPASQLLGREKKQRERRVRLRFHDELKEGIAKVNPELLKEIGEGEYIEIVVAHRHKFRYRVEKDDSVPPNEVWVNGAKLPEYGVSDNTIVTVRTIKA
ncbi:hypothetical protein Pyrde_0587 [Pyrodictium delaneyi]|uniref:Uncharacterized protein n=1 Tax=Pyrodictium delaneyi TaxID=1273541 RepID=A0A0P0N198_9CREN|nr:hypothetical protein [Pyrodictium delaneyi]ALL00637.1 hypothetical protein Pyrde_0587 [Pyrodictium delaneyi]OWJ54093.1 hypothetical protein Pdsh_09540 [Pyrodictium delaneyi]